MRILRTLLLSISIFVLTAGNVWACSVCFGDPESKQTEGLNWAVIILLVILVIIFGLFIKFLISFNKRVKGMAG